MTFPCNSPGNGPRRLSSLIEARRLDDTAALIFEGETLSYRRLWESIVTASECFAQHGVVPGSKVLLALSNSPAFVIALLALNKLGAVAIPVNPSLVQKELARVMAIARPRLLLGFQGQHRVIPGVYLSSGDVEPPAHEPELRDVCLILFTSGTTGTPKGVLLTDDALILNAQSVAEYLQLDASDRTLVFLPLYYSFALSQILTTLLVGGTVVLMKNLLYPVQAMKAVERHGITGLGGVPTSLSLLAAQNYRPQQSPRFVMSAGGPLPSVLVKKLDSVFPRAAIFNNYGCTEVAPRATTVNYAEYPDRIGSIGRPISNVRVTLVRADRSVAGPMETGEIVLGGPTLMKGYYRDPEGTAARMSVWGFHTGDYAYADEDGFLYYQGRNDDLFKCGGEKVSTTEIEDVMLEHQGVLEVAVVAQRDAVLGHVSVAYVVRSEEGGPTEEDLQLFCRRKLSAHKVPRLIHFMDKLDRTDNGKIQKFRLKESTL
jgi:acyl-CoA synthetase (AMP-forming)/AMP-acid ligase II